MSAYILTDRAAGDLHAIWDYIADDNVDAADRVIDALYSAFGLLAKMPYAGHVRRDWTNKPVLFFVVGKYHVVYDPERHPVEVITILHGARDVPGSLPDRLS